MSSDCVSCNAPPPPCNCKSTETCVQTSRDCNTCPRNICIQSSTNQNTSAHSPTLGSIVSGAVGGLLGSIALVGILFFVFRKGLLDGPLDRLRGRTSSSYNSKRRPPTDRRPKTKPQTSPDPLISSQPPLSSQIDPGHQKNGSTSSRRISQAILNKRTSAHMMEILDPAQVDPSDHSAYRSGDLLSLEISPSTDFSFEDDPFSDRNANETLARQLPPLGTLASPLLGSDTVLRGITHTYSDFTSSSDYSTNQIPVAYIPSTSKSLSIQDVEDRDGLGNPSGDSTLPSLGSPLDPMLRRRSTVISIDPPDHLHRSPNPSPSAASALKSSFLSSNTGGLTPPPSSSMGGAFKPIRPPRAPDLDLRLPSPASSPAVPAITSTQPSSDTRIPTRGGLGWDQDNIQSTDSRFSVDSSVARQSTASFAGASIGRWSQPPPLPSPASSSRPRPNYGSSDGMPIGSRLSLDSSYTHQSFMPGQLRPLSNVSDATTHDSHLSSILDPAMIVTPVTLVRTASGRQAAVQRVALRGQEKARVVRLNNSTNTTSSNSSSSSHSTPPVPSLNRASNSSLRKETLLNSSIDSRHGLQSRTSLLSSTITEVGVEDFPLTSASASPPASTSPGSDARSTEMLQSDPFTDLAAVELTPRPTDAAFQWSGVNSVPPSAEPGVGGQATSVYSDSTTARAVDGHGSTDNVSSRAPPARTPSTAAIVGGREPTRGSMASSVATGQRLTTYSMARSSMSGDDSFMDDAVVGVGRIVGRATGRTNPEDFPMPSRGIYASQHLAVAPQAADPHSRIISLTSMINEEEQRFQNGAETPESMMREPVRPFTASTRRSGRASVVSTSLSVRSGYGSVLEGIPFNIGFNSGDDDFGGLGDLTGVDEEEDMGEMMEDAMAGLEFVEKAEDQHQA